MAQDLSRQATRRQAQERITNNRDAILPTRREDRTPDAIVRADMRNAFRGNSADEVRRALGLVNDAAEAWNKIDLINTTKRAEEDYASGGMDATSGAEMDPAKAKQLAYQRGYYRITAEAKQSAFENEVANRTTEMVNSGATPDEIHAEVMKMTKAHAEDVATIYPLAEIKTGVAERTSQFISNLDDKLNGAIRDRTTTEMVQTAATNVQTRIRNGERIDFDAEVKTLKEAGIDPKRAKTELMGAVVAVALDPANPRPELVADLLGTTARPQITAKGAAGSGSTGSMATTFEDAVPRMFDREGGYTPSDGASKAPAKYGINQKANPDVNVATLTKEQAAKLYKERYWDAIDADNLPPAIRELAFDTAVNHGVGRAKTLIAKANGDPARLIALRRAEYARLAKDPAYAPSARSWESRLKGLEADLATLPAPASEDGTLAELVVTGPVQKKVAVGIGSFTPAEQQQLLNSLAQAENLRDRNDKVAKENAKDALMGEVYEASQNGVFVDEKIDAAVAAGDIDASDGMALRNASRSLVGQSQAGQVNVDLATKYDLRLADVEPNYQAIRADATRDYHAGMFGTGQAAAQAYLDVMKATASGSRAERALTAQQKVVVKSARTYVTGQLRPPSPAPGMAPDQAKARLYAQAVQDFEARVQAGGDAMESADKVIETWGPRINGASRPAGGAARGVGNATTPAPKAGGNQNLTYDPVTKTFK